MDHLLTESVMKSGEPEVLPQPCPENMNASAQQPPPYSQEPPPYSTVTESHTYNYTSTAQVPPQLHQQSMGMQGYPPQPLGMNGYPQQSGPQTYSQLPMGTQGSGCSQLPRRTQSQSPYVSPGGTVNVPTHPALQPSPSCVVQVTGANRRTTKSVVTDLETGKEYFVKEKTSRHGLRSKKVISEVGGPKTVVKEKTSRHGLFSKKVIKEVGGPKTVIKETPSKTVVCQKRH